REAPIQATHAFEAKPLPEILAPCAVGVIALVWGLTLLVSPGAPLADRFMGAAMVLVGPGAALFAM
ncbi:MAG: hypothetical protein KAW89_08375, partial [Armatimonadetes bacterium]|nr:hypothetical protein [Armatimonadota bacterium]